jgi:hypothetical protein
MNRLLEKLSVDGKILNYFISPGYIPVVLLCKMVALLTCVIQYMDREVTV